MIPEITIANYEPLANINFDQTLARVGHINRLIRELNAMGLGNPACHLYEVCAGSLYPTIQSAIDQAVIDGAGIGGVKGIVRVKPGVYPENLTFAPGVAVESFTHGVLQPEQVFIDGQHTYTPVTPFIFDNSAALIGVTLRDPNAGHTITYGGIGQGLFIVAACFVEKANTGNIIRMTNPNSVLSIGQNVFLGNPVDPIIKVLDFQTFVCQQNQFNASPIPIELDSTTPGATGIMISNLMFASDIHLVKTGINVSAQLLYNTLLNFAANSNGIIMDSTGNFVMHNTINVPSGTGYAVSGAGNGQFGANTYTDNILVNPTFTVNPVYLEPPRLNLPTSPVGLPVGALWNNLGVVNIV